MGATRATFFVLGWVAKRFPEVVKMVHKAGHEIASHTCDHQLIYKQSRQEFRESVRKSKQVLEDLVGEEIIGFRSPNILVLDKALEYFLDILIEERYRYDSSIFPVLQAERFLFEIDKEGKKIIVFPVSTLSLKLLNIPISSFTYRKFLSYYFINRGINTVNRGGHSAVICFHSWELDARQPRIPVNFLAGMRHYYNLKKTEEKIGRLLKDFSFDSFRGVLKERLSKGESFSAVGTG